MVDFLVFLAARLRYDMGAFQETVRALRNAIGQLLAAFVEAGVECLLQRDREIPLAGVVVTPLYSTGGKRLRISAARKLQLLQQMQMFGSANTLLSVERLGKGLAALMKSVHCRLYLERSRLAFSRAKSVILQWDGGTHGGLSFNVGMAYDHGTGIACVLRPQVWCEMSHFLLEKGKPEQPLCY